MQPLPDYLMGTSAGECDIHKHCGRQDRGNMRETNVRTQGHSLNAKCLSVLLNSDGLDSFAMNCSSFVFPNCRFSSSFSFFDDPKDLGFDCFDRQFACVEALL